MWKFLLFFVILKVYMNLGRYMSFGIYLFFCCGVWVFVVLILLGDDLVKLVMVGLIFIKIKYKVLVRMCYFYI